MAVFWRMVFEGVIRKGREVLISLH